MECPDEMPSPEVKIEIDVAEDPHWKTQEECSFQDTAPCCSAEAVTGINANTMNEPVTEPDTQSNTMSGPIRKELACQWIKTEPVEEKVWSHVLHQFQSQPMDKTVKSNVDQPECWNESYSIKQEAFTDIQAVKQETFMNATTAPSTVMPSVTSDDIQSKASTLVRIYQVQNKSLTHEQASGGSLSANGQAGRPFQSAVAGISYQIRLHKLYMCDMSNNVQLESSLMWDTRLPTTHTPSTTQSGSSKTFEPSAPLPKLFTCDVCNVSFRHLVHLMKHKDKHVDQVVRDKYACKVCEKSYSSISKLKKHMSVHTEILICDVCGKKCYSRFLLNRHKLKHPVCDVCDKRFKRTCYLRTHKLVHSEEKPFVCDICDKGFTLSQWFKRHMLTHAGEKPDVCDKQFTQSVS